MNSAYDSSRVQRFGAFEIDLAGREIRKHGMRLRLEGQLFQILEMLLAQAGHVVTRRTLKERLWPDTHVGYNHSLNTAINKLRELLGDSAQNPRFVETVPRVGYRFIAPVLKPEKAVIPGEKKMMAVLPFEDLSSTAGQDYFADGLTEEMISHLGQMNPKRLGVIARTSSIRYKDTKKTADEIAQELKVQYLLEGSVRRADQRVRITAQLIAAGDQTHLWSATYDRELRDVLSVQADVARQVGMALAIELLPQDLSKALTLHEDAHESYLRGRFYFGQRTEQGLKKAIACFEAALSIEPGCARSLSGIADASNMLCWFGALSPEQAGPRAAQAATRAIQIDPSLSEPHASLALAKFWHEWNWKAAEEEFLRALELNPSYASAHQWYASFLCAIGHLEEGQLEQRKARELDPHSLILNLGGADVYFFGRQFDRAIEHLLTLLDQEPRFAPALFNLGRAYVQKGLYAEAITAFEKAVDLSGNREGKPALAHAYALAGREEEARAIVKDLVENAGGRYMASTMMARVYLGLGEVDEAFEWLKKSVRERSYWNVFLNVDPVYDAIREDSRFQELLEQVGFGTAEPLRTRSAGGGPYLEPLGYAAVAF